MPKYVITIIGMGPRGVSVLNKIINAAKNQLKDIELYLHLVDSKDDGQGVHNVRQPQYLLTNTLASQVTMFDSSKIDSGPSFTEWADKVGYRRFGNYYCKADSELGQKITDVDYIPRNLLGEYLVWSFDQLVSSCPNNIRIEHHRNIAIDVSEIDGNRYEILTDNGFRFFTDYVFLTTGHGTRNSTKLDDEFSNFVQNNTYINAKLRYFKDAYPIEKLTTISRDSTVLIQGFGLTAHDAAAELTVGRGGQFIIDNGVLVYQKSGKEPKIILFSRSCLPFAARGTNQKGLNGQYNGSIKSDSTDRN